MTELSIAVPLEIHEHAIGLLHLRSRSTLMANPVPSHPPGGRSPPRRSYRASPTLGARAPTAPAHREPQRDRPTLPRRSTRTRSAEMILMHLATIVAYDRGAIMLQEGSEFDHAPSADSRPTPVRCASAFRSARTMSTRPSAAPGSRWSLRTFRSVLTGNTSMGSPAQSGSASLCSLRKRSSV